MNLLIYKGYTAELTLDSEANLISGRVLGLRDVIYFEAETPAEASQAFHDSVDDYLAWCAEDGREPEKPYSGQFRFRTTPERHRMIARAAAREGKSINAWADETLAAAARRELAENADD